jgi:hypothetical protein
MCGKLHKIKNKKRRRYIDWDLSIDIELINVFLNIQYIMNVFAYIIKINKPDMFF